MAAYEEGAEGVKFTLAPRAADRGAGVEVSEAELSARRGAEFRRVATMHTRGGR